MRSAGATTTLAVECVAEAASPCSSARVRVTVDETVLLTNMAEKAGVDGALILPPYFVKLTDDEIFAHYRDVSARTKLPILLYNIPGNAVNWLMPPLVRRLADLDNVVAIKESSGDWNNFYSTLIAVADKIKVFCGPSSIYGAPAIDLGADGFVDCFPNVWADGGRPLFDAAKNGDTKRGRGTAEDRPPADGSLHLRGPHALSGDKGRDGHAGLCRRRPPAPSAAPHRRRCRSRACARGSSSSASSSDRQPLPRRRIAAQDQNGRISMTIQTHIPPKIAPREYKTSFGEFIGVGPNGNLWVDGCDVKELADRFGTPLFLISENQLRFTYRKFRDAFRKHYPGEVEILFANKSNNGLAIRHIMNQEGAGGDCFGVNEMYLALLAGTNPKTLVLNGSNKEDEELEMAIMNGLCINIDAMDELDRIDAICKRLGKEADIGIRLKLDLEPLAGAMGVAMHGPGTLKEQSDSTKWGMTREQTVEIVKRAQKMPHIHLKETHFHLSRMTNDPMHFAIMTREMVTWSGYLRDKTGWTPATIDTGGGWTFGKWYGTGPNKQIDNDKAPTPDDYARLCSKEIADEAKKLEPAAPEAAAGARPLALRPVGRGGRTRRSSQGAAQQEMGQHGPLHQPPFLGGHPRLVLPFRRGRGRGPEAERDRRSGRPALQLRRGRTASQDAAAEARRLRRVPRRRRLLRIAGGALQRAASAGDRPGLRRPRRGHHGARTAEGCRRTFPRAAAAARRFVRAGKLIEVFSGGRIGHRNSPPGAAGYQKDFF